MNRWMAISVWCVGSAVTIFGAAPAPVAVTVVGEPRFTHRDFPVEVVDVPEDRQAIYQTWCTGEIGLRVSGLADGPHRVRLA